MHIPSSTYRVQLHKDFTFRDLEHVVDYLYDLGITTIYAAPIFRSTPGSMHGYDVTDPHQIDPEIGTLSELRSLSKKLKSRQMSWIQDIVPNHMAFHLENMPLADVMERGPFSPYYHYFDINWESHHQDLHGKLQVPFLGKALADCVVADEIKISFSEKGFTINYFDQAYPLSLSGYAYLKSLSKEELFCCNDLEDMGRRAHDLVDWKRDKENYLAALIQDDQKVRKIHDAIACINSDKGRLLEIVKNQYYLLEYWKSTESRMAYRRFFTVNELICLRMEDEMVFEEYHNFIHQLYKEGLIQGLRIDHIDGLKDPATYIKRLRNKFGKDCYIIAEKILESKETLPTKWEIEGTSGYEFLAYTNKLITNRKGARELIDFYRDIVPNLPDYDDLVLNNKNLILRKYMAGEWDNLMQYFIQLGLLNNFSPGKMKHAMRMFMISLPVYRIYPDRLPLHWQEAVIIGEAFKKALSIAPEYSSEIEWLEKLFLQTKEDVADNALLFLQRLMQFTGPLTAKGVEDTTFYIYNALISHDEVGDTPSTLGISIERFHKLMLNRKEQTPFSLNATATHDTKRGEDARLRLNCICEFPQEWVDLVTEWFMLNVPHHIETKAGEMAPVRNDEYYIYQSIIGGFPEDFVVTEEWIERFLQYQTKAVREAKLYSDWADPDNEYERACHHFVRKILQPDGPFLRSAIPFIKRIIALETHLSCAQALLKTTTPGIPDVYQGCELWDLSFVDPDNRRPVDYQKRMEMLINLHEKSEEGEAVLFSYLEDHKYQGILKMFVLWKVLNFRKQNFELFTAGDYMPLEIKSQNAVVIAFARVLNDQWCVVIIPLSLRKEGDKHLLNLDEEAEVVLPGNAPGQFRNIFTNETLVVNRAIKLKDCLLRFGLAVLYT